MDEQDREERIKTRLQSTGDVAQTLAETAEQRRPRGLDEVVELVGSAVRAAAEADSPLGSVAKGLMLGILRASEEPGKEALRTLGHAASSLMKHAHGVSGDLAGAAKGAVEGAIQGASELGMDASRAASAAAQGALDAAHEIGADAAEKVRSALTGTIGGVKIVLKEPFKTIGKQ